MLAEPSSSSQLKPFTRMLETYVPGYDVISDISIAILGIKPDVFILIAVLYYIVKKAVSNVRDSIWTLASQHLMSTVVIGSYDELYECVMEWLANEPRFQSARSQEGSTPNFLARNYQEDEESNIDSTDNIDPWDLSVSTCYVPTHGTYFGWPFSICRYKEPFSMHGAGEDKLLLMCIGWSTSPIKHLIQRCRKEYYMKRKASTSISLPLPEQLRTPDRSPWAHAIPRLSRSMETIILNKDQKSNVLQDVAEFLNPTKRRWYNGLGIPYRRGYLFSGPPGTGKTSLSFALAGHFALKIHSISLSDPTLTDDGLGMLYRALPDRCIVLLEDIDATHLTQRRADQSSNTGFGKCQGLSLSGLLNILDGVASPEGIVLIMTTNHPEKLDAALIRPGRIDLRIPFALPQEEEIEGLFIRMYTEANRANTKAKTSLVLDSSGVDKTFTQKSPLEVDRPTGTPRHTHLDPAKLQTMARTFMMCFPKDVFSPADIQGFLILKKTAELALATVKQWVEDELAAKAQQRSDGLSSGEESVE